MNENETSDNSAQQQTESTTATEEIPPSDVNSTEPSTPPADPVPDYPKTWDQLGLSPEALELIKNSGFETPTEIQARTIPPAIQGLDIIGSSRTGSGKTASFVLPMVEKFFGRQGTFGLVLAPTREIAQQIQQTLEIFATPRGIRSIVLIGGIDMKIDQAALETYPQIIVATPGRLCDHLERGNIWLEFIEIVVLDEADRMLDMGFSDQLNRIMQEVPESRQTLLFSATIPPAVRKLADATLREPVQVNVGVPLQAATTVEQRFILVPEREKLDDLMKLLSEEKGSIIIFTRSKDNATELFRRLHSRNIYDATYLHSDRIQAHREQALAEFKEGKHRILIATDVAARGIHVDGVAHVVNYELPMEAEDYIHRIGRTGRMDAPGKSTTFVTMGDKMILKAISQLVRHDLMALFPDGDRDSGSRGRFGGRGRFNRNRHRGQRRGFRR